MLIISVCTIAVLMYVVLALSFLSIRTKRNKRWLSALSSFWEKDVVPDLQFKGNPSGVLREFRG